MLYANNIDTPASVKFVKQATQTLFTPQLRKISNTVTKIAGDADIIRQGSFIGTDKKTNPWIQHVKEFAKENDITYFKALSDPRCKTQYRKIIGVGVGKYYPAKVLPDDRDNKTIALEKRENKIWDKMRRNQDDAEDARIEYEQKETNEIHKDLTFDLQYQARERDTNERKFLQSLSPTQRNQYNRQLDEIQNARYTNLENRKVFLRSRGLVE
jgi:hypothetical protein